MCPVEFCSGVSHQNAGPCILVCARYKPNRNPLIKTLLYSATSAQTLYRVPLSLRHLATYLPADNEGFYYSERATLVIYLLQSVTFFLQHNSLICKSANQVHGL